MQEGNRQERLSSWDLSYAVDMAIACLISYSIVTYILSPFLPTSDALLGGMWATVATVFVFRETRADNLSSAGISRLVATCVSICAVFGLPRDLPLFIPQDLPPWSGLAR